MKTPREPSVISRSNSWLLALLAILWLAMAPAAVGAHAGHDEAAPEPVATDPNQVVRSLLDDNFEVVLKYRSVPGATRTRVQVFVSDYTTNMPIEGARVRLRTSAPVALAAEAAAVRPGIYEADLDYPRAGDYTMILTIEGTTPAEFALASLPMGKALAQPSGPRSSAKAKPQPVPSIAILLLGALVVAGAIILFSRRRANRLRVRGIQAAFFATAGLLAWNCPGAMAAVGSSARYVPKDSQFLLGVRTALVRQEPLREQLTAIGHVVPESGALASVSAPQAGRLERAGRALAVGDRVRQGQLLGYLLVIDRLPIRAPISGLISELDFIPGQWVQPGQQLARVLDDRRMRVEVPLFGANLAVALRARSATIHSNALPDRDFPAQVRGLAPTASTPEQGGASEAPAASAIPPIILTVQNTGGFLRPGMLVETSIESSVLRTVLSVPASAIVYQESGPGIFVHIAPELFEYRAVAITGRYGGQLGIAGAVKPGERVVTEGGYTLVSAPPANVAAPVASAGTKK